MKNKPVWRLNTGSNPSDLGEDIIFFDMEIKKAGFAYRKHQELWTIGSYFDESDIYAYQTNRTKKSKFICGLHVKNIDDSVIIMIDSLDKNRREYEQQVEIEIDHQAMHYTDSSIFNEESKL